MRLVPAHGIVDQSYVPDLYLHIDDRMPDNLGRPSSGRITRGDWKNFSDFPVGNGHACSKCQGDNVRGDVVHCDEPSARFTENVTPYDR